MFKPGVVAKSVSLAGRHIPYERSLEEKLDSSIDLERLCAQAFKGENVKQDIINIITDKARYGYTAHGWLDKHMYFKKKNYSMVSFLVLDNKGYAELTTVHKGREARKCEKALRKALNPNMFNKIYRAIYWLDERLPRIPVAMPVGSAIGILAAAAFNAIVDAVNFDATPYIVFGAMGAFAGAPFDLYRPLAPNHPPRDYRAEFRYTYEKDTGTNIVYRLLGTH